MAIEAMPVLIADPRFNLSMNIVVPDYIDLPDDDKAYIQTLGNVTVYTDLIDSPEVLLRRIQDAELVVVSWIDVPASVIEKCPYLKYIIVPAVGHDHVDETAATQAGVKIINCPTHNALAVAEYTIGLMLALTHRIFEASLALPTQPWDPTQFRGMELAGKILGLIGYGTIGREVARLAEAMGMTVRWATSQTAGAELDALISQVDILSLHLPLTPKTHHLLSARRLRLMKPSAYLVNTARGAIIDQSALCRVLQEKVIAGAALDVFDQEPVKGIPSEEILALAALPNVIATPHIAYNTAETVERLGKELIDNIQACLDGNPINVVN
jgi:phosphoglycerate dehydrogenase-like enzyme